ncbi:MAG TPA: class I tRNA ligase family protein [Planktothrix sp.]|jgi:valyl-tRNA synthetase
MSTNTSPTETPKSAYNASAVEARWTKHWFTHDLFDLDIAPGKPNFSIALPPPNITGTLHMGHALNGTLQDILIRLKRMQGYNVLWQAGTDHAGISAQMVVERKLRSEGRNRHEMGREAFEKEVWQWREQLGGQIFHQFRKLGVSFNWDRLAFTLDESYVKAIYRVFVSLFREGFIYRGNRITNWCSSCQTSLSDLEVEREDNESTAHCERCQTVIEPRLCDQWYVRMEALAEPAIKAVEDRRVVFIPERYAGTYLDWMRNVRDWNISRQLWWGHRIPIWTCSNNHVEAYESAPSQCAKCQSKRLEQDPDVLDTWFSSALWPFATLGWPDKSEVMEQFYPTAVLSTAREIINLWVSRMLFMSLKFVNEVPFHQVLIHPVVQTKDGKRMSKSKGNAVDPLEMIAKYGADANRFYFCGLGVKGDQDVRFREERLEECSKFANKLYNAGKFVLTQLEGFVPGELDAQDLTLADRWILHLYNDMMEKVVIDLNNYDFHQAAHRLYEFTWNCFCDWYLEIAKSQGAEGQTRLVLWTVFEGLMRALHPVMPFITEELWSKLPKSQRHRQLLSIMFADYPQADQRFINPTAMTQMEFVLSVIRSIRAVRTTFSVAASTPIEVILASTNAEEIGTIEKGLTVIRRDRPSKIGKITIDSDAEVPARAATETISSLRLIAPLTNVIDFETVKGRLEQRRATLAKEIGRQSSRLEDADFLAKAPRETVEGATRQLNQQKEQLERIHAQLRVLA